MPDPNPPVHQKYNHLLRDEAAGSNLPDVLAQLDTLYHAPPTPPHLTGYGFQAVVAQLDRGKAQAKRQRRRAISRVLVGILLVVLVTLVGLALSGNWLKELYEFCFIFGLAFTIVSLFLGELGNLGGMHIEGAGSGHTLHFEDGGVLPVTPHAVHEHQGQGNATAADPTLGWFSLTGLVVFVAWFGGVGFILFSIGLPGWLTLPLAIAAGIAGYLLIWLVLRLLSSSQTPIMRGDSYDLVGTTGEVSSGIHAGGLGEIVYTKFGGLRSSPARSQDGLPLPRGAKIVVLRYADGIAYVQDLEKALQDPTIENRLNSGESEQEEK